MERYEMLTLDKERALYGLRNAEATSSSLIVPPTGNRP